MRCFITPLLLAVPLSLVLGGFVDAQQPGAVPQANNVQAVFERIHQHASNGDGQKERLQDDQIEAWLDKLVAAIAKAAELPDLKVPVRLANVKPVEIAKDGLYSQALIVGKEVDLKGSTLRNSIVLADGSVELYRVEECVVVARGAVSLLSSQDSAIVAGAYVGISDFDGRGDETTHGSLILSRGWADVRTAHGSIIAAPGGVSVSSAQNAIFINAAIGGLDRGSRGSKTLNVPDLPLDAMPVHPLTALLKVQGVLRKDGTLLERKVWRLEELTLRQPLGVVFQFAGRRYVADLGKPIVDEVGQQVEGLRDWKLAYASDAVAIFRNGDADVVVRIGEK